MRFIKHLSFSLCLILFVGSFSLFASCAEEVPFPSLSARAAALYEVNSDTFLIAHNAEARMPMASTTKIMTALAALEVLSPEQKIAFPRCAVGTEGSSAYLCEGEVLSVEDMLYALLLQSANDVAVALAVLCDGSMEAFSSRMNALAEKYGCINTHFDNSHGLHSDTHYTTAKDLAIITKHLLQNDLLRTVVSTKTHSITTSLTKRTFRNHNKLLFGDENVIGVKTGFTKASGRCLVGALEKDGMTLISVTLSAPSDWADHKNMWDYALSGYEYRTVLEKGAYSSTFPVVGALIPYLGVTNDREIKLFMKKSDPDPILVPIVFSVQTAPIKEGDTVGKLVLMQNGKEIASVPLRATHTLPQLS